MKKLIYILLLLPAFTRAQIVSRAKSFQFLGTTAVTQYSGTTAQRPTGDFRLFRWNSDSSRLEVKISSTTWRGLLFNGEGGGGGGTLTSINSQTGPAITMATGTTGSDFNVAASSNTVTYHLPTASASVRGALSTTDWSTFNAKIGASDTAAITSRAWRTNGNNMAAVTGKFGTTSNDHVDFITNNAVIGRMVASGGWGFGITSLSSGFKFQSAYRALFMSTPTGQNEFAVDDDGANNQLATFVINTSGTNNRTLLLTTLSGNALEVRQYGTTTVLFSIGANAGATNPGAPLTHLYTDAGTTGKKWAYSAINTFNPTSGGANRDGFLDSTTINQTGGANGPYNSFHSILIKTACASCGGVWIENADSWFGSTSGNVAIGLARTVAPTARLHLAASTTAAASLRIPTGTAPTSPNEGDIWSASNFAKYYNGSATRRFAVTNDATPTNGQIPIGNGTDYTVAAITAGTGISVTNGAGSITIAASTVAIDTGSYTPTLTNVSNCASATFGVVRYERIGNRVHVWGMVSIDPTLAATSTVLEMTLPIASDFSFSYECAGTAFCGAVAGMGAQVTSGPSDGAAITFVSTDLTSQFWSFHYSYVIIAGP